MHISRSQIHALLLGAQELCRVDAGAVDLGTRMMLASIIMMLRRTHLTPTPCVVGCLANFLKVI